MKNFLKKWVALDFLKKEFNGLNRIYREEPLKLILVKRFRTQEISLAALLKDLREVHFCFCYM